MEIKNFNDFINEAEEFDQSYDLVGYRDKENIAAAKLIDQAILNFAKELDKIDKKYPDVGLTDSDSRENISTIVYRVIAGENIKKAKKRDF